MIILHPSSSSRPLLLLLLLCAQCSLLLRTSVLLRAILRVATPARLTKVCTRRGSSQRWHVQGMAPMRAPVSSVARNNMIAASHNNRLLIGPTASASRRSSDGTLSHPEPRFFVPSSPASTTTPSGLSRALYSRSDRYSHRIHYAVIEALIAAETCYVLLFLTDICAITYRYCRFWPSRDRFSLLLRSKIQS